MKWTVSSSLSFLPKSLSLVYSMRLMNPRRKAFFHRLFGRADHAVRAHAEIILLQIQRDHKTVPDAARQPALQVDKPFRQFLQSAVPAVLPHRHMNICFLLRRFSIQVCLRQYHPQR